MYCVSKANKVSFFLFRNLPSSRWLNKDELEEFLLETISDKHYTDFIKTMDRLLAHPYSFRSREFIMNYRKDMGIKKVTARANIKETLEDGRTSVTITSKHLFNRI